MKSIIYGAVFTTLIALVILTSCSESSKEEEYVSGIILENMDTTSSPQKDFYRFVNGTWVDNAEIPPEYPRWGGFIQLYFENQDVIYDVLKVASSNADYTDGSD